MTENQLWLIGAGNMAYDYAKILSDLQFPYTIIGRGEEKAKILEDKISKNVETGGIDKYISQSSIIPKFAIVATPIQTLYSVAKSLIEFGVKHILLEKPGALNLEQLMDLQQLSSKSSSKIFIGYNRRYYTSVQKAKEILVEDGGPTSLLFEFTEWGHQIVDLPIIKEVKENWVMANSSHVIDMAFYLAGFPKHISSQTQGTLSWHPKSSVFVGSGITKQDVPFAYHANWDAPGRWWIEINSSKHRLIFRPLETLQIQVKGSIKIDPVEIDDSLDRKFKPGLYLQTKDFIELQSHSALVNLKDQIENMKNTYNAIINGNN